jgi:negative regulator of flagellin synthesis FlgM
MKVDNDKSTNLLDSLIKSTQAKPLKDTGVREKSDGGVSGGILDKVELSSKKDEINRLKERVKTEPAIRQDKVDQVRQALQAQTYNVKGELVARGIMKSQLLDEML